jgi:hypothetical protein
MIAGFCFNRRKFEGIYYFYRRVLADVQPNSVTFIAALAAREGEGGYAPSVLVYVGGISACQEKKLGVNLPIGSC